MFARPVSHPILHPIRPLRLRRGWAVLGATLQEMIRARQTRRMLAEMEDRMLADIGIGRSDAAFEAARPMWDVGPRPPRRLPAPAPLRDRR